MADLQEAGQDAQNDKDLSLELLDGGTTTPSLEVRSLSRRSAGTPFPG
jgi:hypothetical protein